MLILQQKYAFFENRNQLISHIYVDMSVTENYPEKDVKSETCVEQTNTKK